MPVKTDASPRRGQLVRRSLAAMTGRERARVMAMYGVILGLHVAGFVIFVVFVVPSHYQGLGIGVPVLAYTLGLRHAFDAGAGLRRFGGLAGTLVSASFLFMIGLLNLVILAGIVRIFAAMRSGEYDEAAPRQRRRRSRPARRVSEPSGRGPSGRGPSGRGPPGRGPGVGLAEVGQGLAQLPA